MAIWVIQNKSAGNSIFRKFLTHALSPHVHNVRERLCVVRASSAAAVPSAINLLLLYIPLLKLIGEMSYESFEIYVHPYFLKEF